MGRWCRSGALPRGLRCANGPTPKVQPSDQNWQPCLKCSQAMHLCEELIVHAVLASLSHQVVCFSFVDVDMNTLLNLCPAVYRWSLPLGLHCKTYVCSPARLDAAQPAVSVFPWLTSAYCLANKPFVGFAHVMGKYMGWGGGG